jgi:hypothetical protein
VVGRRYIDGDKLLGKLPDNGMATPRSAIHTLLEAFLKRQPRHPQLVSRQGAAEIIGVQPPHLSRLKDRLPEPIVVQGSSWPVYLKADIIALAKNLEAEKKARKASAPAK